MKIKDLKVLIKECYNEVLKEYQTTTPSYDSQSKENTDVIKISKQDPQKQQKIINAQKNKQSYELYEEENQVNEMARVPKVYSLGPNAEKAESKLASHPKVLKVIDYIKQHGPTNIKTMMDEFGWRQQQFNPFILPLVDAGILKDEGFKWEPKNPAKIRNTSPKLNKDDEELFDDEEFETDGDDLFVGFADKYDYVPREEDETQFDDVSNDDSNDDVESLDSEIERTGKVPDDIEAILNDDPFTIDDIEDEDDLFEIKQLKYRAGLVK